MHIPSFAAIACLVTGALSVPVDGPVNEIEARFPHRQPPAIMLSRTYTNSTSSSSAPTTSPTAGPACPGSTEYCCRANAVLAGVLDCVSVLGGGTVRIPISILGKRDLATRQSACAPDQKSLCCTTNAILSVITCTDILSGLVVSVPITLG